MAGIETITMSMREIDRLKTVQAIIDGNLKPMQAGKDQVQILVVAQWPVAR